MMQTFTPREIVSELDKYIIGQKDAKRSVAIALRNRWRRQQVPEPLRDEIAPKNIIMIGPTGVGKTEIADPRPRLQPHVRGRGPLHFPSMATASRASRSRVAGARSAPPRARSWPS